MHVIYNISAIIVFMMMSLFVISYVMPKRSARQNPKINQAAAIL